MDIYIDLDEVLADFTRAACAVHGWTYEMLVAAKQPNQWDMMCVMGMTHSQFWLPIEQAGEDFWLSIEPLPWAHDVVQLINRVAHKLDGQWFVLTSPHEHLDCYLGKLKWMHTFFNGRLEHCLPWRYKYKLGRVTNTLIDDRESNLQQFAEHGGRCILFPSWGNRLSHLADDPIPTLKEELEYHYALNL